MKNIPTPKRVIEIKRKRRVRRLRFTIFYFILLLFILGVAAYFSNDQRLTINNVVVSGTNIIKDSEVVSYVNKELSGRYIHLYSKANGFIYPKKSLYRDLPEEFPRIKELSINIDKLNTLNIKIEERFGSYLYCGSEVPVTRYEGDDNCYFINKDGYIFDKAPYFSGNVYFKFYLNIGNLDEPLGQTILEEGKFQNLIRFVDEVEGLGFKPVSLYLSTDGVDYLYLDYDLGKTEPKIIFRDNGDLEEILDNLSVAMGEPEFANEINSKYDKLLYIDLKFKNKVLYKFE